MAGAVASAVRYIAKAILKGDKKLLSGIHEGNESRGQRVGIEIDALGA